MRIVHCPHCQHDQAVPPSMGAEKLTCPVCGLTWHWVGVDGLSLSDQNPQQVPQPNSAWATLGGVLAGIGLIAIGITVPSRWQLAAVMSGGSVVVASAIAFVQIMRRRHRIAVNCIEGLVCAVVGAVALTAGLGEREERKRNALIAFGIVLLGYGGVRLLLAVRGFLQKRKRPRSFWHVAPRPVAPSERPDIGGDEESAFKS